ncbi:leucine-rich repeat domain-containing protein, partial [Gardnerella vaginalis]|uniref:leucine-rich repeat domain-containing protein n=1 Tax=Gardnerella vaginalis TaxID=2702 RepID=UPI0039EF7053
LRKLYFSGNQVSNLDPLKNLKKLRKLEMGTQTISIKSVTEKTTLPVNGLSGATFTIQNDDGNSIGSINNGVFTLSKELPYSDTIYIKIESENIKIGNATSKYAGTIKLHLDVPKTDSGVTTWAIKAKMEYKADPNIDYKQKRVERTANDGTRTTYADGRKPVEVPAQDGLTY